MLTLHMIQQHVEGDQPDFVVEGFEEARITQAGLDVNKSCSSCSLSVPRDGKLAWKSSHIALSCFVAPGKPRIPRARCTGSSAAKLQSFMARLFGVRPIFSATSMIIGLLL